MIKQAISAILNKLGYRLINKKTNIHRDGKINLNIGSGGSVIDGFVNLDLKSGWYHGKTKQNYIEYDIRKDNIPFNSNVVSNIYCSHVIEHLKNEHVKLLFSECYRVLTDGGVFRISCPDAKFLWNLSKFENDYWSWRLDWFKGKLSIDHKSHPTQSEFLIREVSTPKSRFYRYRLENQVNEIDFNNSMEIEMSKLVEDLQFRDDYPGDHINFWHNKKIARLGMKTGFRYVIEGKRNSSVSAALSGDDIDLTGPQFSLYVDLVK